MEQGDHYLPPMKQTATMEELAVFFPILLPSLMWILPLSALLATVLGEGGGWYWWSLEEAPNVNLLPFVMIVGLWE